MEEQITLSNEHGSWQTLPTKKWLQRKAYKPVNKKEVRATIPGIIVRVTEHAVEGVSVKKGTPLLELEAMKMINTIVAPLDGTIAEVTVKKGTEVGKDNLLISFE